MKERSRTMTGWAAAVALIVMVTVWSTGCGGGGGDGPEGSSSVVGNVRSVSGGGATYVPSAPATKLQRLARAAASLLPNAWAAVEGVSVRIVGTDLVATTADDGSFVFSGVPAGERQIVFTFGSTVSSLLINVPENATVRLRDIDVSSGGVDVSNVEVEIEDDDDNGNGNDDNANGNDDDDNENDDNGNDNDDGDDNGNDNGGDDNGNDNDGDDNSNDNGDDNDNDDNDNS